jgi:hypothetical protein
MIVWPGIVYSLTAVVSLIAVWFSMAFLDSHISPPNIIFLLGGVPCCTLVLKI